MMNSLMLIGGVGPWELAALLLIALLLFGKRLPEVARSMGKGISEFKKGMKEVESDINKPGDEPHNSQKRQEDKPIDKA